MKRYTWEFPHKKHSVLTEPDEHMPYIIRLHIMSKRSGITSGQFIWLVSENKTEAVNPYLTDRDKETHRETETDINRDRERCKSDLFVGPAGHNCCTTTDGGVLNAGLPLWPSSILPQQAGIQWRRSHSRYANYNGNVFIELSKEWVNDNLWCTFL